MTTRKVVVQLCLDMNIPLVERPVSLEEMPNMDEAFFTGTTTQIAPIVQMGDHIFYQNDAIGTTTAKLQSAMAELKSLDTSEITLP